MVGYVLRPGPDKGYVSSLRSVCLFRRYALGGVGRFRAGGRARWPALPIVSLWHKPAKCALLGSGIDGAHSHLSINDLQNGIHINKTPRKVLIHWVGGGSGEIRTHEGLPLAGFQDRCNRPLCHASGARRIIPLARIRRTSARSIRRCRRASRCPRFQS